MEFIDEVYSIQFQSLASNQELKYDQILTGQIDLSYLYQEADLEVLESIKIDANKENLTDSKYKNCILRDSNTACE